MTVVSILPNAYAALKPNHTQQSKCAYVWTEFTLFELSQLLWLCYRLWLRAPLEWSETIKMQVSLEMTLKSEMVKYKRCTWRCIERQTSEESES